MEFDRAHNFNDRLNQWVAAQGFWFQLKYSMTGRGIQGAGGYQFLRMMARLMIFLLVIAAGVVVYLVKRADGNAFREGMEKSLVAEIGAKEGKMEGLQRLQGKLSIGRFAVSGTDGTFFTALDAKNISCRMGLTDGLAGRWNPGPVMISTLDIDLRAGAKDADLAATLGDALFKKRPKFEMSSLDVEDATVSWGYSELTRGLISNSHLKGAKLAYGWRFQFKGGTFSQNWLRGLEIEELTAVCSEEGVVFEKAIFKKNGGTVDMTGLKITGKERPVITGTVKLSHIPLDGILPSASDDWMEGKISGTLKVSGSTNDPVGGIAFDGKAVLTEGDEISLRDRIHLLKALRVVDVFNSYRRVNFREGSFSLKTGGGNVAITHVDLKSDAMTLTGQMKARKPTAEETKARAEADPNAKSAIFNEPEDIQSSAPVMDTSDFTLKRAGKETQKKEAEEGSDDLAERYTARVEERKFAEEKAAHIADSLQYEGMLEIGLPATAFEKYEKLGAEFPKDAKTGRIQLKVPIEGYLGIVTLKQAEEIYEKSKR